MPLIIGAFENRLKNNTTQNYIVGDKMTIADFAIAAVAYTTFLNEGNGSKDILRPVAEKFPDFMTYIRRLGDEELKEHLNNRPSPRPW